jgi:hypothetical protein
MKKIPFAIALAIGLPSVAHAQLTPPAPAAATKDCCEKMRAEGKKCCCDEMDKGSTAQHDQHTPDAPVQMDDD